MKIDFKIVIFCFALATVCGIILYYNSVTMESPHMLDESPPVGFDDNRTDPPENRITVEGELTQKICDIIHLDICPESFPGKQLEDGSVMVGLVKSGNGQQEPERYQIIIKDGKIVDWYIVLEIK